MDIARFIGIGIVMIIPTFVVGGAVWAVFHSWIAALIWVVLMGCFTGRIIQGRMSHPPVPEGH